MSALQATGGFIADATYAPVDESGCVLVVYGCGHPTCSMQFAPRPHPHERDAFLDDGFTIDPGPCACDCHPAPSEDDPTVTDQPVEEDAP